MKMKEMEGMGFLNRESERTFGLGAGKGKREMG
jgi:hypothetical protein